MSTLSPKRSLSRNAIIVGSVLLFHAIAIWVLQTGLLRRAVETIVPVELLSQIIDPPRPEVPPPPPPAPPRVTTAAPSKAPQAPQPLPQAIADPTPAPNAPTGTTAPQAPLPPITAPVTAAPVAPPAAVQAPMVDADYAANAELFRRPKTSQRLGEFGRVVLRVTVGVNGFASKVELQQSSNFERLDQAAINGAKQLKFRPAMRAGVPVEWTYLLPVNYSESQ